MQGSYRAHENAQSKQLSGIHKGACAASLACLFLLALGMPPALGGPNVLLLWDDSNDSVSSFPPPVNQLNPNTQSLISAFQAAGIHVTLSEYTQGSYDGFSPSPTGFDVVVHLNGNSDALDVMPNSGVSILTSYVKNSGGGFITSENSAAQMEIGFGLGLSAAMRSLMLLGRDGGHGPLDLTVSVVPGQAAHPLWRDLPASFTVTAGGLVGTMNDYDPYPALLLATDDQGSDAVAVREYENGRAVAFKFAGNSGDANTLSDPNVQRLYINAILWSDRRAPVVSEIALGSGSPRGGGDLPYIVRFSEGVQGVDAADFSLDTTGGLTYEGLEVSAVSEREYEVVVRNAENDGACALSVIEGASITDRSYNSNPLYGGYTGPEYSVDGSRPRVAGFDSGELVAPLGSTPELDITFSEPMNTSLFPAVTIATEANGVIHASPAGALLNPLGRAVDGLLALYTFDENEGDTVRDVSGVAPTLDLTIETPGAVAWGPGGLTVLGTATIASPGPAAKVIEAVKATNAISIEAWVTPADTEQIGPARIVTLSQDTGARNVTLGQDGNAYQGRLRTTDTSENGIPAVNTSNGLTATALQHIVYTRDAGGQVRIYVDGAEEVSETVSGNFSNWDGSYRLGLANEFVRARLWRGEFRLVALYDRALSPEEVDNHFEAGVLVEGAGDGAWLNSQTYRVSFNRALVEDDEGSATVTISGGQDLAGNAMRPDSSNTMSLIGSVLTVVEEPPAYVIALAGDSQTFEVAVQGNAGPPSYQWYRRSDNGALTPVGPDAPAYTIASLEEGDSGVYYCVITDALSSVQTNPTRLLVAESIPAAGGLGLAALALLLGGLAWVCGRRATAGRH